VISDWDRKSNRRLQVTKGIKCFEYIQRPSFIVTSGRDKIIRLWNPYLLAKPAGQLKGHTGIVSHLAVNNVDGQIISISEDRVRSPRRGDPWEMQRRTGGANFIFFWSQ
jgi:WD40 repeat protein